MQYLVSSLNVFHSNKLLSVFVPHEPSHTKIPSPNILDKLVFFHLQKHTLIFNFLEITAVSDKSPKGCDQNNLKSLNQTRIISPRWEHRIPNGINDCERLCFEKEAKNIMFATFSYFIVTILFFTRL